MTSLINALLRWSKSRRSGSSPMPR